MKGREDIQDIMISEKVKGKGLEGNPNVRGTGKCVLVLYCLLIF